MNSKWRESAPVSQLRASIPAWDARVTAITEGSVAYLAAGSRADKYLRHIENVLVAVGKILMFPAVLE
jgi:hypothetical protein